MSISGHVQQRIIYDVAGEISVEDSILEYDEEMLEYRDEIEEEWSKLAPGQSLHVPTELDGEPEEKYEGRLKKSYLDKYATTGREKPKAKSPGKSKRLVKLRKVLSKK
jgi:hypothetical protein